MIADYQKHVESLASQNNCDVKIIVDQNSAMMYVEFEPPYIEVPKITDQITYLISLHELGHVANNHTQGRPPFEHKKYYFEHGVLKCEAEAWNYALDNCIDELTGRSRRFIWNTCLGSYYSRYLYLRGSRTRLMNGNRHHVEFAYDHPNSYFENTVKRIQANCSGFMPKYIGEFK